MDDSEAVKLLKELEELADQYPDPCYDERRVLTQIVPEDDIFWAKTYPQFDIILSRAERRRNAGLHDHDPYKEEGNTVNPVNSMPNGAEADPNEQGPCAFDEDDSLSDRPGKRRRIEDSHDDSSTGFGNPEETPYNHGEDSLTMDYMNTEPEIHQTEIDVHYNNDRTVVDEVSDYHWELDATLSHDEPDDAPLFDPDYSNYNGTQQEINFYADKGSGFLSFTNHDNSDISQEKPDLGSGLPEFRQVQRSPLPAPTVNLKQLTSCVLASHALGIDDFVRLRARKTSVRPPSPVQCEQLIPTPMPDPPVKQINKIPDDVYDRNTLRLPPELFETRQPHRYLTSLDILQKQVLLRELRLHSIEPVERESLSSVDVIFDPYTAAISLNLLALPSQCERLTKNLVEQSWRYDRILVVFEAYQPSKSYKSSTAETIFAYSAPVLRAIKKLRRDLGLMQGAGRKREACAVKLAFANSVEETAAFIRMFGDDAQFKDQTSGVLWNDRSWLDEEIPEVFHFSPRRAVGTDYEPTG